jgi:solute carrier family 35 (UDP-sugar transporter), member A1/2/3
VNSLYVHRYENSNPTLQLTLNLYLPQLKVLTTAGFSVLILHTSLSWTKWRALALLVLGCTLVASPTFDTSSKDAGFLQLLGYGAVLTEVLLSGFASIYFEKVVKSTSEVVTIWERNFQLGFYSLIMYGGIIIYEGSTSNSRTAWSNWTLITILVSILGAAGGLLVAATLKYADSIMKTMATAGAIVLSTVLGHYFLDGPMSLVICIGAIVTIISISNYTLDATPSIISTQNNSAPPSKENDHHESTNKA